MSKQEDDFKANRKKRNWAILGGLVAFVVIIYAISILKMAGN